VLLSQKSQTSTPSILLLMNVD